jgi:LmbE family N-acetylglucosaminyl deacetylase
MPTALSLLAHPDDAEVLCAGTLIRLRDLGWDVHVAAATPGDAGSMTMDRYQAAATRTAEATRAAKLIGATFHCLGERDAFVVYEKHAIQKTVDLLRRVDPSLVFTHAPADYHVDHEQVSLLARAATFVYAAPNTSAVPVPKGAAVPHLYYCDAVEGVDPFGRPVVPTTVVDVTSVFDRKAAMLECHQSQFEWLRAHHGITDFTASIRSHGEIRGKSAGVRYAEAFVQHRGHAYPHDDLLGELLR